MTGALAPLSSRARAIRLAVIAPVALAVAWCAGLSTFTHITRLSYPELAVKRGAPDGLADAALADEGVLMDGAGGAARVRGDLARRALVREPVNPVALRILALDAQARGRDKTGLDLLHLSERFSRRDMWTQLLLIEQSSQTGDVPATLARYDIALRTSQDAVTLLFPVLTSALPDPKIRAALVPLLRANPPWMAGWFYHAMSSGKHVRDLAQLVIAARGLPKAEVFGNIRTAMVSNLANGGDPALAAQVAAVSGKPGARTLSPGGFDAATTDPMLRPLTWEPVVDVGRGVSPEDEGRAMRAFASPGERGVVLRRYLLLSPGAYALHIAETAEMKDRGAERGWRIACVGGAAPLWESADADRARFAGLSAQVRVPERGCAAQLIELTLAGGLGQDGLELLVRSVRVERVRAGGE